MKRPPLTASQTRVKAILLVLLSGLFLLGSRLAALGSGDGDLFFPLVSSCQGGPALHKIAFVLGTEGEGWSAIYAMNSDGTGATNLTQGIHKVGIPVWSPDGSQIAFERQAADDFDIYVMDADGCNRANITNRAGHDANPAWAPDGSRIVYERWEPGTGFFDVELYTMRPDGSDRRRLTDNQQMDTLPSWSPDGSKIAYEVWRSDGAVAIYVMDADGSNPHPVTDDTYGVPEEAHWVMWQGDPPQWSPDGAKLTFVSDERENEEIYVVNADGTGLTNLTNNPAHEERSPAWSPDGATIAFSSDRAGPAEIFVMDADGGNVVQLTDNAAIDDFPAWSPDGARIAFASDRDRVGAIQRAIYVMDADGSHQTKLSDTPFTYATFPTWSPR